MKNRNNTAEFSGIVKTAPVLGHNIYKEDFLVDYYNSIEEDTFEIVKYLGLKVSFERQRLIITKDFTPKNKEENMVAAVKRMIISIRSNALEHKRPINSIDILAYLILSYSMYLSKDLFLY